MIEPDNASIAKRRKERDVARPLCAVSFSNSSPGACSGRTISATRSVMVIESTLSLNVSSRSVSASRIVNIFVGSTALQFAISIIGVIVFVGLTAYDTQRIKQMYLESDTDEIAGKKAVLGALALYLDFINLFMLLLQLFGQRRQD
jgi:FtsH-binding integral membrane protein